MTLYAQTNRTLIVDMRFIWIGLPVHAGLHVPREERSAFSLTSDLL